MSQAADKAIQRWVDRVSGKTTQPFLRSGNIVCREDRVYSYGEHFEMARPLRDKAGEIHAYLLNGDTYSNTTSGHQSTVRQALARTKAPLVIIPHEALGGAGIDLDSIKLVHVLPDRMETIRHHYTEEPPGSVWVTEDVMGYRDYTPEEIQAFADKATADAAEDYRNKVRYAAKDGPDGYWAMHWLPHNLIPPEPVTAEQIFLTKRKVWCKLGTRRVLRTSRRGRAQEIEITLDDDGTMHYRWETRRHWLGESLIRARVDWTTRHRCLFCDERGRIYGPLEQYSGWGRCKVCFDGFTRKEHHRWAYFLSGFDHQEARPLYFLCELPRGAKPATVQEAYEALKPEPVKMAEQMNRPVERQGDIFAIPTETLDNKTLRARGARIETRSFILNTNHTATQVAYLPDGVTLARGTMYHDPAGRQQDHARHRLGDGKTWHVVIKNTVPTTVRR